MPNEDFVYDVVVVGAGNAGFAAVHAAREQGVTVGLLEKAPVESRGGNSALTGHLRFAYDNVEQLMDILGEQYKTDEVRSEFAKRLPQRTASELWDEIMLVTDGMTDQDLLKVHIAESYRTIAWLHSKGHDWVPSYEDATTGNIVHCEGMGYGLQERNFAICERDPGVTIHLPDRGARSITRRHGPGVWRRRHDVQRLGSVPREGSRVVKWWVRGQPGDAGPLPRPALG